MIAASLLLITGAVTLLVLGLWQSSSGLLGASIAASVLAAVALLVGARRLAIGRPAGGVPSRAEPGPDFSTAVQETVRELRQARPDGSAPPAVTAPIPVQALASDPPPEPDPVDEPPPQQVSADDAARVGQLQSEVLVVDGRPRYHRSGCVHLLGRENEPLPVWEAIELGFSPCSLCEPDSALLADARRV